MNFKDRLSKFNNFALANNTTIYNEDSTTASALIIECNKKIQECMKQVEILCTRVEALEGALAIEYESEREELELTINAKIEAIREQINSSYVYVVDEDSLDALELAGNCAKSVNECLKAINMMTDIVEEVNEIVRLNYVANSEMLVVGGTE